MQFDYFLFFLALAFTIFASVQDLRKREVANWLNFSLVSFALIYRLIYSLFSEDFTFFLHGLAGFGIFFILANLFYYCRVFAGGDAKLLMGFGVIMPYNNYYDFIFVTLAFIILLFVLGAIYSVFYSTFIAYKNRKKFSLSFSAIFRQKRWLVILSIILAAIILAQIFFIGYGEAIIYYGAFVIVLMPFLYIYLSAIEKSCMIVLTNPGDLTEGDWIEKDILIGRYVIKKSVHGLSMKDILILRKLNKKIYVKQGVPFVPAFLFALIVMVFFYSILKLDFASLFFYLF